MAEASRGKTNSDLWANWVWLIFVAMVVFPPLGIAMLWKSERFTHRWRVVLSVVAGVIFVLMMVVGQLLLPGQDPTLP